MFDPPRQAPLSLDFQGKNTSGLPFLSQGDLPDPGIKPMFPAWQADSLPLSRLGSPIKRESEVVSDSLRPHGL